MTSSGKVLLSVTSFVLALVALELGTRWMLGSERVERLKQKAVSAPAALWENHPYLPFVGVRSTTYTSSRQVNGTEFPIEVRNNAFGFRTRELERDADDFVVVCLGDSTTWGEAAKTNESTWPAILESLLAQGHPERTIRVFNFGVPVTTSGYSLVAFALLGARLSPDVVIVYHGRNEMTLLARAEPLPDESDTIRDLGVVRPPVINRVPAWMRRSSLALWVAEWLGADSLSEKVFASGSPSDILHLMWRNARTATSPGASLFETMALSEEHFQAIEDLASARGGHVVFATSQFRDPDGMRNAFNESLREWFRREGKTWVDLDEAIEDHRTDLQFDDVHFTEKGRLEVAQAFLAKIEELGVLGNPR